MLSTERAVEAINVDEFLDHSTVFRNDAALPLRGALHLHATDAPGEWLIAQDEMLYRRIGTDQGEIVGDSGVVERFLARTDLN